MISTYTNRCIFCLTASVILVAGTMHFYPVPPPSTTDTYADNIASVAVVVGVVSFYASFYFLAKAKGHLGIKGLLLAFFLGPFGMLVTAMLGDRTVSPEPPPL